MSSVRGTYCDGGAVKYWMLAGLLFVLVLVGSAQEASVKKKEIKGPPTFDEIAADSTLSEKHKIRLTQKRRRWERRHKVDTSAVLFQPVRHEISMQDRGDEFHVIQTKEKETDLFVAQDLNERGSQNGKWVFHLINDDLKKVWVTHYKAPSGVNLIGYDYSKGYYFLVYEYLDKWNLYHSVIIEKETGKTLQQDFELPFDIELQYVEALDNGLLFVGNYRFKPVVVLHDVVSGKPKVLPGFFNQEDRIFDLVINDESRIFSVVLARRMRNGKYTTETKTFTYDGLLVEENIVNPGERISLIDGTTRNVGNGVQLLAGTYAHRNSLYSNGIFISKFVNGRQKFLKNYNYGDLNNFFAFRGEKAESRIKRRIARKKSRGKTPKFNYRLYIHDITSDGEQNVLVAEAYYPKYQQMNPGFGYYNRFDYPQSRVPQTRLVGYRFTHAIIVSFDKQGNVLWDNSFRTNDITVKNLQASVAVNNQNDRAVIMYLDENVIKSKVVEGDQVVEGKSYTPVKLLNKDDQLLSRDSDFKGLESWYDNFLYTYGVQSIRNKYQEGSNKRRRVFFLNKIQFEESQENIKNLRSASILKDINKY